jgi:ribosomal protein S19
LNRLPIVWPKQAGDTPPPVRTQARSATILPSFVGLRFDVHNGKIYNRITITEDMVGHKLGEFSPYVFFPGRGIVLHNG